MEIRKFLESVYGLNVAKVNTLNVEGKKKRGKTGAFFRRVSAAAVAQPACPTLCSQP